MSAAGNASISTQADLTNQGAISVSKKATVKSSANITNSGTIVTGQELSISANTLDNKGTLKSSGRTTVSTRGYLNNTAGAQIISDGFLSVNSGGPLTNQGDMSASDGATLTSQNAFFNSGILHSKGDLWINADQSISNYGTISADRNLSLTTYGTLFNQKMIYGKGLVSLNAGGNVTNQGTIGSDSRLTLTTAGSLLNNGTLYSRDTLEIHADNGVNNNGTISTSSDLNLTTKGSLLNDGTIYTNNNATINAVGSVTNAGTIGADHNLTLTTSDSLHNKGTLYSKGTGNYSISGNFINSKLMRSEDQLILNADGSIVNEADIFAFAGLNLSSGQSFYNRSKVFSGGKINLRATNSIVNASALVSLNDIMLVAANFNNTSEALLAAGVNDNGEMTGHGDIAIKAAQSANLQGQIAATGEINVVANGINLSGAQVSADSMVLQAQHGGINTDSTHLYVNNSLNAETSSSWSNLGGRLYANQLTLNAASLNNDASSEISANTTQLNIRGTLTNRGLIEGMLTHLQAQQIDNYGTGRIHGIWLQLQANTINNRFENGSAATLTGGTSINIGTNVLNNYAHSQIFSNGDISIGQTLDENGRASGLASEIHNHSATIEAQGNLKLAVNHLQNINDHFATELREVSHENITEYSLNNPNNRYTLDQLSFYQDNNNITYVLSPENPVQGSSDYYKYTYTQITRETTITENDPAKILAGGNLTISADSVLNDESQITAGNALNIDTHNMANIKISGIRSIDEVGTVIHYGANTQLDNQYTSSTVTPNIILQSDEIINNAPPYNDNDQTPVNPHQESYRPNINIPTMNIDRVTVQVNEISGPGEINIVATSPAQNIPLPDSNLYIMSPAVSNSAQVESDPKFTHYKTWLASDYMVNSLKTEHNNTHKRLSDDYYGQQFVRDQISNLAGQHLLNQSTNDEDQYAALIKAGLEFAQKFNIPLGAPLTSEQMSNLTSDIIWLINREVIQADGTKQTVQVPQVYAVMKL
ncbi:beta strand repeat-containing protein [Limnobaculum parvum]